MDKSIPVHVWSDIACPWCFIGRRRFEAGIEASGLAVAVEYHSFELSPETPVDFEGTEVDFLTGYKGITEAEAEQMLDRVTALAAGEGLRYDFAALRHTRTLLAHQTIQYAKTVGLPELLVERLFRAYFEEGRHLGRVDELVELAGEAGLDKAETRQILLDGRYAGAVDSDIQVAGQLGIHAVPFYVIGQYAVSGAQPASVFAESLKRAAELDEAG